MYQKDYILRMIEMLGDLIAAILGLIKKGDYNQASERLGSIYYDTLKEDFFRAISKDELTLALFPSCWSGMILKCPELCRACK
jgi:hypothetical protein